METNTLYQVTKQFDIYYCCHGRITVNPGATFYLTYDNRIYFIHSNNYLPMIAQRDFINHFGYKKIDNE